MIAAQGGDWQASLERYQRTPSFVIESTWSGYVTGFDTRQIGLASVQLGAGRLRSSDTVDPAAGIVFHVRRRDRVEPGMPLATPFARDQKRLPNCADQVRHAIEIGHEPPPTGSIVLESL
jgi:thymidine phosphorylase